MKIQSSADKKLVNLKWAVKSRSENQQCAIRLYELLTKHSAQIKKGKFEVFAQGLVSVTFSLWRAALLADKIGGKEEGLKSAIEFLETVIADNSITYAYDKKQLEWTFNYYTNNACYTLIHWSRIKPRLVPGWEWARRSPKERWEYGQKLLTEAVERFAKVLRS